MGLFKDFKKAITSKQNKRLGKRIASNVAGKPLNKKKKFSVKTQSVGFTAKPKVFSTFSGEEFMDPKKPRRKRRKSRGRRR